MAIDKNGKLLEDANHGVCTPTFAGFIVLNQSNNGWVEWKTMSGKPIDIFRKKIKTSNCLYKKEYTIIGRLTRFEVVLHDLPFVYTI